MRQKIFLVVILLAVFVFSSASIWKERNIYSSSNRLAVGDIIIVYINDVGSMQFALDLKNNSNSTVTTNPDVTITAFLPKVSGSKSLSANDKTDFSSKTSMTFTVAARVTALQRGGKYRVVGIRTYAVNGVIHRLTVSGTVDPALLDGRRILSNTIANFRMEIRGTKETFPIKRDPLKKEDKADTKLTEEEKQKIIIDYLQKMVGELTR